MIGRNARAVSIVEECARKVAERYSIDEIRIPLLERLELYQRSSGETSDVVEKQMYAFTDRDEAADHPRAAPRGHSRRRARLYRAGIDRSDPEQRFYYFGPMFRRERPQKGRFRQFNQFGVEIFGRADAACDAELMIMVDEFRRDLGLEVEIRDQFARRRPTAGPPFARRCSNGAARISTSFAKTAISGWNAIRCGCSTARTT